MIKRIPFAIWVGMIAIMTTGCGGSGFRKSAAYYTQHQAAIATLRSQFDSLQRIQPFSIGFTSRDAAHVVMEVPTDTLRYIFNSQTSGLQLWGVIKQFHYDTAALHRLVDGMRSIGCLWLEEATHYIDQSPLRFTMLSFESVLVDRPFEENKYYVLVFIKERPKGVQWSSKAKAGGLVPINDSVFFTIANRFR